MHTCLLSLLMLPAAVAVTTNAFSAGVTAFKLGDLHGARRQFEAHLAQHPGHAQSIAIVESLDALGIGSHVPTQPPRLQDSTFRFAGHSVHVLTPDKPEVAGHCDTSGTRVWSGAPALLEWLSDRAHALRGRRVLELGAGHGLVGCGIARLGASEVVVTDLPQLMPLLRANVGANEAASTAAGCTVAAAPLAWGTLAGTTVDDTPWDIVVAANCCYDAELVPSLASTVGALLSAHPTTVALLALSNLSHFGDNTPDYTRLLNTLGAAGFSARRVGSVDPARVAGATQLDGGMVIADAHRDHMIDIFAVGAGAADFFAAM